MEVETFEHIQKEFMERIARMVWCNMATIDSRDRPRSRIVHPLWDGPVGWLWSRSATLKAKHLARNPFVSLAYVADVAKPVYVDCHAGWVDDLAEKQRIWDFIKSVPPPLGYDPEPLYSTVDNPKYGLLRFAPWRIEVADLRG